ncbi:MULTISPECIES: hypothetical protein [unclassified Rhizobium]|uniref:hypothetical protein n=1 Tax=unclassified Rhizobium TaxID=2613769 RepID=UPI0007EC2069|nr:MULTISPECIES: hypothetical protein [unclassified Rhizobium]ANK84456.1 hypothetical protein AMK02_CH00819 [Rhizobium sp. N731]ANL14704.1 hypothetical protein AMJ97_CH00819 [Rhizobium sp. N1314]
MSMMVNSYRFTPPAAGNTLEAEPGSFAVAGNAAAFKRALRMSAAPGAFVLGGNDAGLIPGVSMPAAAGTFALAGNDVSLRRSLKMPAAAGSLALTGKAATLSYSNASDAVVAYANFQLPSATGNFQITTGELGGRTPKMAVFCLSNAEVSETGHGASGEEGFHNFGATDGTNQWSVMSCTEFGTNSDNRGYVTTGCLYETNAQGTLMLAATFVSFDSDGVTINITTLHSELYSKRGFVIFFAGSDCHAEVGVIAGESDGTATKTIGFTPEGLLMSDAFMAATGLAGSTAIQTFGFALNDGSATQYDAGRYLASGTGEGRVNNKAAGYGANSIPTCTISFSGANVTATYSTATDVDLPYAAWSFGGRLTAKAGTITTPTSPGQVSASGLGITPVSALFLTGPGAVNTTIAGAGFGAGWLTASGGGSMGALSKTGYCSTTRLNISNGADLGEFEAFASGSLTVDFVTADATARLLPFIAFGT